MHLRLHVVCATPCVLFPKQPLHKVLGSVHDLQLLGILLSQHFLFEKQLLYSVDNEFLFAIILGITSFLKTPPTFLERYLS